MLSDSMRSLVLEAHGYQTDIFDYVPASETPKNIMLRAVKGSFDEDRARRAQEEYRLLRECFHAEPKLADYLAGEALRVAPPATGILARARADASI